MPGKSPADYLVLLTDTKSLKRRSGAKSLGKTSDPIYGPHLLKALEQEVLESRTYETQCAIIRALADVGYEDAIPFLWKLAGSDHTATSIYLELGFCLCRLHKITGEDLSIVRRIIDTGNPMFANGAFLALYFLRIVPSQDNDAAYLLEAARTNTENEGRIITNRSYLAAAAAKWKHPAVSEFLQWCSESDWRFLRDIVQSSQAGEYPQWRPW